MDDVQGCFLKACGFRRHRRHHLLLSGLQRPQKKRRQGSGSRGQRHHVRRCHELRAHTHGRLCSHLFSALRPRMNQQAWNISLEHLDGGYDGRSVLKDFSATIPAGAITTILGESGCGKTTLLRLLLGLNRPFAGSIRIWRTRHLPHVGRTVPQDAPPLRRAFSGWSAHKLPHTLAENVALPLVEHTTLPSKTLRDWRPCARLQLVETQADLPQSITPANFPAACASAQASPGPSSRSRPCSSATSPTSGLDPITAAQMDQLLLAHDVLLSRHDYRGRHS